jgi:hypothetical protein
VEASSFAELFEPSQRLCICGRQPTGACIQIVSRREVGTVRASAYEWFRFEDRDAVARLQKSVCRCKSRRASPYYRNLHWIEYTKGSSLKDHSETQSPGNNLENKGVPSPVDSGQKQGWMEMCHGLDGKGRNIDGSC